MEPLTCGSHDARIKHLVIVGEFRGTRHADVKDKLFLAGRLNADDERFVRMTEADIATIAGSYGDGHVSDSPRTPRRWVYSRR